MSVYPISNNPTSCLPYEGDSIPLRHLRSFIVVLVCLASVGINLYADAANGYASLGVLVVAMTAAFYPYRNTSIGAVVLFSAVTLFIVPTYSLIYVDAGVSPAWFALFILAAMTINWLVGPDPLLIPLKPFRGDLAILIFIASVGLLSQFYAPEQVFHACWGFCIVHLERLHVSTKSTIKRLTGLAVILTMVGLYSMFFWGGYGRLILASFALAPILTAVRYGAFKLNFLLFGVGAGSLVFIGRVIRFGWSDGVAGLADDSGASPLTLSQGLWEQSANVIYHEPLWHQWSLIFLQWFPRAIWPNKPIGLNYTLVDVVLGRQGLGEEHSTATGYFGEHIFLIPDWWLAASAALTVLIGLTNVVVRKVSKPYASANIVFNSWLVTLFWGGMADFGSRVWFSVVPMVVYIFILSRIGSKTGGKSLQPLESVSLPAGPLMRTPAWD